MKRKSLGVIAFLLPAMMAAGHHATAADSPRQVTKPASQVTSPTLQVISSDVTALSVPLGVDKSVVFELPRDISEALVASPKIVNAIVRSKRRVYIIGLDVGQTNVYFFDADGREILGLNISVSNESGFSGDVITAYRGMDRQFYTCTQAACSERVEKSAPNTTIYNSTTNFSSGASSSSRTIVRPATP